MIRFGPSGNSDSFYAQGYSATKQQPAWLYERGLNALEYSFGRGVRMTEKTAAEIRAEAKRTTFSSASMRRIISTWLRTIRKKWKIPFAIWFSPAWPPV